MVRSVDYGRPIEGYRQRFLSNTEESYGGVRIELGLEIRICFGRYDRRITPSPFKLPMKCCEQTKIVQNAGPEFLNNPAFQVDCLLERSFDPVEAIEGIVAWRRFDRRTASKSRHDCGAISAPSSIVQHAHARAPYLLILWHLANA